MAGIIKAGSWRGGPTDAQSIAFNFEDMSARADDYLERVRGQARQIIAQAQQQAETIAAQARERGQQTARQEAEQHAGQKLDAQLTSVLPALHEAVNLIRHEKANWQRRWETETVRLASAIAAKIVRRELDRQPEISLDLVREALQLALGGGRIKLYLHPEDLAALGERIARIAAEIAHLAPADIVADPEVSRGGCRVATEFGTVDQTVEAQLARIQEELT